jgi:hypothetical protein
MRVYKITTAHDGVTWVAAESLIDALNAIPDRQEGPLEDDERYPMKVEVCEAGEIIEVHYDEEPPASNSPTGMYHYDEGLGTYVIADTAMSWADWAEASGKAQAFSAERWAP